MRTLAALIRVQRWQLDEKRRALAGLERLRADLADQIVRLESEVADEQAKAKDIECGAFAYGGFALGVIERRARLAASLSDVDARIRAADEDIKSAFQDLKRYEIALDAREKKAEEQAARRRQIDLDEISLEMHRRQSG